MKTAIPHALPYAAFVAVGASAGVLGHWTDAVRCLLAGLLLLWFWRKNDYPEFSVVPTSLHVVAAALAGVAIGALWVPLSTIVPLLPFGARDGMDPAYTPYHAVAFRIVSMVIVAPLVEELLVRSAIPRLFDSSPDEDWRLRPVGVFTRVSAFASIGFFTMSHPEWLAALVTGIVWTALLAWSRNLRAVVISHAIANLWLADYVLVTGDTRWW